MRRPAANNRCGNVNGRRTSFGNSSQVLGGDLEFFYFTLPCPNALLPPCGAGWQGYPLGPADWQSALFLPPHSNRGAITGPPASPAATAAKVDRKSTRLNSSHR